MPNIRINNQYEFFQEWLKRLRSGLYVQGPGSLRQKAPDRDSPDLFCCIGVACEVAYDAGMVKRWYSPTSRTYEYGNGYNASQRSSSTLPEELARWLREVISIPTARLIGVNDADEERFSEIADYLERLVDSYMSMDKLSKPPAPPIGRV